MNLNSSLRAVVTGTLIVLALGIVIGTSPYVTAQTPSIPSWVKTTAKLWGEGQISDSDFINALQYLIDHKILVISNSGSKPQSLPLIAHNTQNTSQVTQSNTASQTQSVGKSVNDILPTQNDIGMEWIIHAATSNNVNGTDYLSSIGQIFTKSDSGVNTIMNTNVYGFSSTTGAQQHYNSKIDTLKSQGGYKEVSGLDPNCYGVMFDYTLEEKVTVYCFKDNFYMVSSGVSSSLNLQDDVITFAKAMLGKS